MIFFVAFLKKKKKNSVVFSLKVSLNILYNFFCTKDDSPLQYTFSWAYLYNFLMILHAWLRLGPEISFFLAIFLFRRLQASDHCRIPEVFYKKAVIKNFAKLCRKTPVLEPLFNKVAGLQACNFIKNKIQQICFPVNIIEKFLITDFSRNICERLLDLRKIVIHFFKRPKRF